MKGVFTDNLANFYAHFQKNGFLACLYVTLAASLSGQLEGKNVVLQVC